MQKYFKEIEDKVHVCYAIAEGARKRGLDPQSKVEIPLATSLAGRVVGLISVLYPQINDPKIVKRILDLEKEFGQMDPTVSFKIAEEIAKQKFCKFENQLQAIDAGIRLAFAYVTLGVVSSPIEGFTGLKLGKTKDGKEYFKAFFSGPIRSAGTTASCVALMLINFLREEFGYAKYDPDEQEVKRYVTENYDYHERVTNLQYLPSEEEIYYLAKRIPIQIDGDPTEKREVSNQKDLPRVETNFIRGGMCLCFSEGLAQKAQKGLRMYNIAKSNGVKMTDFDFLQEFVDKFKMQKKKDDGEKKKEVPTYIKDIVAGRPIFGHPSRSGAFRFRYGRSRVAGFSAASIHPATMGVSNGFLANGTQLKIEKPTKGCVVTPCDSIDGPIVRLKNGNVKKLKDFEESKKLYSDIDEIIYFGDILFPLGDVINRNYDLLKVGYVEEWWELELKKVIAHDTGKGEIIDKYDVDFEEALKLSKETGIPLHPEYIYYWTQILYEDLLELLYYLSKGIISEEKLVLPFGESNKENFSKAKRVLELLGVEHEVSIENIILDKKNACAILTNLGLDEKLFSKLNYRINKEINEVIAEISKEENKEKSVLELINIVSKFKIKDKAGTFIGTRMGRPEKAKLRKLIGSPSVLFPIGEEGGRFRSVNTAVEVGYVKSDFPIHKCKKCNKETIYYICEDCGEKTSPLHYCRECHQKFESKLCPEHKIGQPYCNQRIDIKHYFNQAIGLLGIERQEIPELIKGVRGTSNEGHVPEHLAKGIIRAKHKLCVNKDGTIRYDGTETPITHFKPKEIGTGIHKLKELGYSKDVNGHALENEEQVIELKPHDILIPACPDTLDERGDDVFIRIANFLDELLVKFYKLKPFYNVKKREDLVGHLVACMAPHNCAGVIGRIIGFSKTQSFFASPYIHAAMRRDCFDYNTFIPIKHNGCWKNVKIGELVEELNPKKLVDNYRTKEKKVVGFETIGSNFKEVKINNFTKHSLIKMLEIKTALGKKIVVTENHKFLIGGKEKRASDLEIGDKLPLPKKINLSGKDIREINLLEELKDENLMVRRIKAIISKINSDERVKILKKLNITSKQFQNFNIRDSYPLKFVLGLNNKLKNEIYNVGKLATKGDNVETPILIELDEELLETIGIYLAEGYSRTIKGKNGLNQVDIACTEKEVRDLVIKSIEKYFGLKPSWNTPERLVFSSKILYLFFTKILGAGSNAKTKRIPSRFLDLKLDKLASVLRGYFEGDGSAEKVRMKVSCDSVSEGLLSDLELCLLRFGVFCKRYEYEKQPGEKVRSFYIRKNKKIPKFHITKLIIGSDFINNFMKIGFLSKRKQDILASYKTKKPSGMKINQDEDFVYGPIISITPLGKKESYCLNVNSNDHLVIANNILVKNCDGDEAAIMFLLDTLMNFSRQFLPSHRGGTQDAPLVLNARIRPGEVDDQILDHELVSEYPLKLYELSEEEGHHSSEIEIEMVKQRLAKGEEVFENTGYTHETTDINECITNSSYKTIPNMMEKVKAQMDLVVKLRAVDSGDVARLIIDRHFIRDLRGNLRKFSQQQFRCVACNHKYRRPPLKGSCIKCGGKIIFTISYGGIVKYLEPALALAESYDVPAYTKQSLILAKKYIESIFGREKEKQESIEKWF